MNKEQYFEKVKSYKFLANKSLGQNFLVNPDVCENIINLLDLNDKNNVLEIGAGFGSLSVFLADKPCTSTLIDVDERALNFLSKEYEKCENIRVLRQNILKMDISSFDMIVGNLPYYITSEIIEYLLLNGVNSKKFVLMTQKEVYPKLTNKNDVSPLSLLLNYVSDISSPIGVSRNNFVPVPHVDSVVFTLTPNDNIKNPDNKMLFRLIKNIFLHRRKTILNCLTSVIGEKEKSQEILKELSVSELKRPEQLDINFYINLLNLLKSNDFTSKIR